MRSDTFSERVPRLSFVANFGENHVNHVLARSLGAFVYSRIDGNRPSVVPPLSVGIKCSQKWSGGAPGWAIFPRRQHRGAIQRGGARGRPQASTVDPLFDRVAGAKTAAVVWSGNWWTERTPEGACWTETPSPLFSFSGAGYF